MPKQIQIARKATRQDPAPGTPDNPIYTTPSGKRKLPY